MQQPSDIFVRKLEGFGPLTDDDKSLLAMIAGPVVCAPAHKDLIVEGETPRDVLLILEGFACRYKVTTKGQRQIMAFLIPGDLCDVHVCVLKAMDHSIATISPCRFVRILRSDMIRLLDNPRLARALFCAALVDSSVLREWLVNIGQRPAEERVAHLFCELLLRMRAVGLTPKGDRYFLPLTQIDLADTMGMTDVHMNRMVQSLREKGLIVKKSKVIEIPDIDRLNQFAGFNPNYLHLGGTLSHQLIAA